MLHQDQVLLPASMRVVLVAEGPGVLELQLGLRLRDKGSPAESQEISTIFY